MTIEYGILVGGKVIQGTYWCRRDTSAWWQVGEFGTRARAKVIDLGIGHWTGGEAGLGDPDGSAGPLDVYDDDGPRVVKAMKARLNKRGEPLQVSISFVIGACDPTADYAPVWQCLDIGLVAAVSVGSGDVNARAIATEIVSAGLPGKLDTRHRPHEIHVVNNHRLDALAFYPGQLRSYVRLMDALTQPGIPGNIRIPRQVPVDTLGLTWATRFSRSQQEGWKGAQEHLHVWNTTKVDAAGMTLRALLDAGWSGKALG